MRKVELWLDDKGVVKLLKSLFRRIADFWLFQPLVSNLGGLVIRGES